MRKSMLKWCSTRLQGRMMYVAKTVTDRRLHFKSQESWGSRRRAMGFKCQGRYDATGG